MTRGGSELQLFCTKIHADVEINLVPLSRARRCIITAMPLLSNSFEACWPLGLWSYYTLHALQISRMGSNGSENGR